VARRQLESSLEDRSRRQSEVVSAGLVGIEEAD